MASKISVVSSAALLLGSQPVISIDDAGKAAVTGFALYEDIYRELLTNVNHYWRFASAQRSLAMLAGKPNHRWQNAFQLPSDPKLLKLKGVYPRAEYEIYEDKIYTDSTTVDVDYIYRVSEDYLPPYYVPALVHLLALRMAKPVTGVKNDTTHLHQALYGVAGDNGLIASAIQADAAGRPPEMPPTPDIILVRG
tara:strand:- start:505 stop:1086 length:582 start_codon:yes stop_codon:yes gene_type:complete